MEASEWRRSEAKPRVADDAPPRGRKGWSGRIEQFHLRGAIDGAGGVPTETVGIARAKSVEAFRAARARKSVSTSALGHTSQRTKHFGLLCNMTVGQ